MRFLLLEVRNRKLLFIDLLQLPDPNFASGIRALNKFGSYRIWIRNRTPVVILNIVCSAAGGRVPGVGGDGRRRWKLHPAVPVQRGSRHV